MAFWIISLMLAGLAAAAILWRMLRSPDAGADRPELGVYRDQLSEIDRDLARGTLAPTEAERLRTEVSRRLLDADRAARAAAAPGGAPRSATMAGAVLLSLVVVVGAAGLYSWIGAPGYGDMPIAQRIADAETLRRTRPSQAEAEERAATDMPALPDPTVDPAFLELMARLRDAVAERPDDAQGLRLLARNEAALGNYAAAARAQARLLPLTPTPTAEDHADLAEYYIAAAQGYVSPEAEAALSRALELDPRNPRARYFTGLLAAQIGRPDTAFRLWRALLEEGPEDAPWIPPIRAQIAMLADLAGVAYTPPAAAPAPGPSAADVEAAGDMTEAERGEMIRGMVEGLAGRLAAEGGPPEDWARLIRALGVLGETDRAAEIWAEAQQVFAGSEADLAALRAAARDAGVAGE